MTSEEDAILRLHQAHTGMLDIKSDFDIEDRADLQKAYTPGVAVLSRMIAEKPELKDKFTVSGKLVALITDGTAVLGLGNVGPAAGLPVIEGKALLYKDLANINAIPLAVDQVSPKEIIKTIKNISLSFAGIHLEDIAAPRCFEIENALSEELDIPVYHDDQEGSAIVVLAGLINAAKVVGKKLTDLRVVINGVGASGLATARLLYAAGIKHLTLVDVHGVITSEDYRANDYQRVFAAKLGTPQSMENQNIHDAIKGQDVFIGLSTGNVINRHDVKQMNEQPIIFALANPHQEIAPEKAKEAGAAVIATGSSQYPNQVNNILAFPGLFKGLLASGLKKVDMDLQKAVAQALASVVTEPTAENIVPSVFNERVVPTVAKAVVDYASQSK
ncbi:NADP-dependent malic enzyme [Limosilactobacillus sp. WILCCON 0053]|uniref:NAD(P)-dependent malic enzyme n=1 Tax=Limosilactobacillus allomucosae TaxID=3142938 RepID=UPI003263013E